MSKTALIKRKRSSRNFIVYCANFVIKIVIKIKIIRRDKVQRMITFTKYYLLRCNGQTIYIFPIHVYRFNCDKMRN